MSMHAFVCVGLLGGMPLGKLWFLIHCQTWITLSLNTRYLWGEEFNQPILLTQRPFSENWSFYLTDPTIWTNKKRQMMNDTTGEMHSNTKCVYVCVCMGRGGALKFREYDFVAHSHSSNIHWQVRRANNIQYVSLMNPHNIYTIYNSHLVVQRGKTWGHLQWYRITMNDLWKSWRLTKMEQNHFQRMEVI